MKHTKILAIATLLFITTIAHAETGIIPGTNIDVNWTGPTQISGEWKTPDATIDVNAAITETEPTGPTRYLDYDLNQGLYFFNPTTVTQNPPQASGGSSSGYTYNPPTTTTTTATTPQVIPSLDLNQLKKIDTNQLIKTAENITTGTTTLGNIKWPNILLIGATLFVLIGLTLFILGDTKTETPGG